MTKEEKISLNHFNFAAYIIRSAFPTENRHSNKPHTRKINIKFAKNSKLIELFADCSDNFDADKLRKQIIKANKK